MFSIGLYAYDFGKAYGPHGYVCYIGLLWIREKKFYAYKNKDTFIKGQKIRNQ